jgi:hypothetical protein
VATPLTNTFRTPSAVGIREDLSDMVSRITPEDTPIYSMAGKEGSKNTHPEWETETLRAPAANAQEEGQEYTFNAVSPPVRLGNWTQIFAESWIISNTMEAVDDAGSVQKRKHQKVKKGIEVRKDIEYAILIPTATVSGTTRQFGSLPTWLTTNVSRGATGANGGYSTGTGLTVAPTPGTQRAFTKVLLDGTMQLGYQNGANFSRMVVSPYIKGVFATLMSDTNVANFFYNTTRGQTNAIIANADYYEGPYGKIKVEMDRVMAAGVTLARNAYLIDTEFIAMKTLRPIAEDPDIAKTGDARKGVIIGETTLKITNEQGLGVIADLFGTTAST